MRKRDTPVPAKRRTQAQAAVRWSRLVRPNFTTQSHTNRHEKAPSAALKGQDDNSPGQARNERALGKCPRTPVSLFSVCRADPVGTAKQKKGTYSLSVSLPRAALRLPGLLSYRPTGLRLGSFRSRMAERRASPTARGARWKRNQISKFPNVPAGKRGGG